MKQKFHRGDVVRIADPLPRFMSHFRGGCEAIILGSYWDLHHKHTLYPDYKVIFPDTGNRVAWYPESTLTFIRRFGEKGISKAEKKSDPI